MRARSPSRPPPVLSWVGFLFSLLVAQVECDFDAWVWRTSRTNDHGRTRRVCSTNLALCFVSKTAATKQSAELRYDTPDLLRRSSSLARVLHPSTLVAKTSRGFPRARLVSHGSPEPYRAGRACRCQRFTIRRKRHHICDTAQREQSVSLGDRP